MLTLIHSRGLTFIEGRLYVPCQESVNFADLISLDLSAILTLNTLGI
jgi:hypothetical protein